MMLLISETSSIKPTLRQFCHFSTSLTTVCNHMLLEEYWAGGGLSFPPSLLCVVCGSLRCGLRCGLRSGPMPEHPPSSCFPFPRERIDIFGCTVYCIGPSRLLSHKSRSVVWDKARAQDLSAVSQTQPERIILGLTLNCPMRGSPLVWDKLLVCGVG